jgi:UDP-N-acetylmuramoyl-tripeptide--D-alanyl-D-alanine ligase
MMKKTYAQLVEMLRACGQLDEERQMAANAQFGADDETLLIGVSTDTRTILPGNLFVPLVGERFDGHDYVAQALASGAGAALWQTERAEAPQQARLIFVRDNLQALQALANAWRRELGLKVVAITGSNGKTTTKDIVAELLNTTYRVHKTPGNLNNHIGLPLTILQCPDRTEVLVAEMGMSGTGEISLLSQIAEPNVAVITMIGEAHLEQLGSREAIADAKMEIIDGLSDDGLFIYNGDEPLLRARLAKLPHDARRLTFGASANCDYRAADVQLEADGATFRVNERMAPTFHSPLLGAHNVTNALAAIAVAESLGVLPQLMLEPLARLKITAMRGEKVVAANGTLIMNDAYNASPASVRAALATLSTMRQYEQKIVVLGDMLELGEQSALMHAQIGAELDAEVITQVYTFGEMAAHIAEAAQSRFVAGKAIHGLSKMEIADRLFAQVDVRTIVLIKGSRGMKLEEIVHRLQQLLESESG